MQEFNELHKQFTAICDSIDKSNKECISNLEKLQNNVQKELFGGNCTPDHSNEIINYGDKHGQ